MIKKFDKSGHRYQQRKNSIRTSTTEPDLRLSLEENALDPPETECSEQVSSPSNLTIEYEQTALESGISISHINLGDESVKHAEKPKVKRPKLAAHTSKHLQPPETSSERTVNFSMDTDFESSCDGVKIVPTKIGSYDDVRLSHEEYAPLRKVGRKSYAHNGDGELVQCTVLKLQNCFAIPTISDIKSEVKLMWCMDRVDLLKRVRASDSNVYVDILISDDLGTKKLRIPYNKITESGIKGLSRYNVRIFTESMCS